MVTSNSTQPAFDILIVDNKELSRDTVQKILLQQGFTVDVARHGKECIEKIRTSNYGYRLIITEMIMPFVGGFEVIKTVKKESRIPVLVLSAVADEDTIREAFRLSADDFLKKPFMATELVQRVQRLLARFSVSAPAPIPAVSALSTPEPVKKVAARKETVKKAAVEKAVPQPKKAVTKKAAVKKSAAEPGAETKAVVKKTAVKKSTATPRAAAAEKTVAKKGAAGKNTPSENTSEETESRTDSKLVVKNSGPGKEKGARSTATDEQKNIYIGKDLPGDICALAV